jgi:hypothetical protein
VQSPTSIQQKKPTGKAKKNSAFDDYDGMILGRLKAF